MSHLSQDQIEKIVQETMERIAGRLREQLAAMRIDASTATTPTPLARAVHRIRAASGQAETLRSLLAAASSLGARAALFVVRSDHLSGWHGVGFEDDAALAEDLKGVRLDAAEAAVRRVLDARESVAAATGGQYAVPDFGQAIRGEALMLPLLVNDHVAGVLYTDPQSADTPIDRAGLETLVDVAGLAVEKIVFKMTTPTVQRAANPQPAAQTAPAQTAPGPAAARAPAPAPAPAPAKGRKSRKTKSRKSRSKAAAPKPPVPVAPAAPIATADEDSEVSDARRFARLLMEEICLYNGDRVEAGRQNKDLASRLSDELQRARSMYEDRVPAAVRARGDYFHEALVNILAVGDAEAAGVVQTAGS